MCQNMKTYLLILLIILFLAVYSDLPSLVNAGDQRICYIHSLSSQSSFFARKKIFRFKFENRYEEWSAEGNDSIIPSNSHAIMKEISPYLYGGEEPGYNIDFDCGLRNVLAHALINAYGHGRDFPIVVEAFIENSTIVLLINNTSSFSLHENINGKAFDRHSETVTVPKDSCDQEGGGAGVGVSDIITALKDMSAYVENQDVCFIRWSQVKDHNRWRVTFKLTIPILTKGKEESETSL